MKTAVLLLTTQQAQPLLELTSRGPTAVNAYRRATALLARPQGRSYSAVGRQRGVRDDTLAERAQPFPVRGRSLRQDRPRSGRPLAMTGPERAALTAFACAPAPDGHRQWSLRLLAGNAVAFGHSRQVSARSAHGMLNKTRYDPTASGRGVAVSYPAGSCVRCRRYFPGTPSARPRVFPACAGTRGPVFCAAMSARAWPRRP